MSALLVVLAAGVACYALRASTVMLLTHWSLPLPVARALRFVAPASIAALLATTLRAEVTALDAPDMAARAVGLCIAGVVAARTRSATAAIFVGMPAVWAVTVIT